jgi:hypothetical protein
MTDEEIRNAINLQVKKRDDALTAEYDAYEQINDLVGRMIRERGAIATARLLRNEIVPVLSGYSDRTETLLDVVCRIAHAHRGEKGIVRILSDAEMEIRKEEQS